MKTTICRLALGLVSAITIAQAHAGFELTSSGPISLYQAVQRYPSRKHTYPARDRAGMIVSTLIYADTYTL